MYTSPPDLYITQTSIHATYCPSKRPFPTPTCVVLQPLFPGFLLQNVFVKVRKATLLTLAVSGVEKGSKDVNCTWAYPRIHNRQISKRPGQSTNTYPASRGQHHTECTVD